MTKKLLIILCIIFVVSSGCDKMPPFVNLEDILWKRPTRNGLLYDYAGVLKDMESYTKKYLKNIRSKYKIEFVVASIPSLEGEYTIEQVAILLMENWEIGAKYSGRGLLLLFVEDEKTIKFEVARELEDVFTDAFTGHVERLQLKPNYLNNQLNIGLVALMEEVEKRAELKKIQKYTPQIVEDFDRYFISQGAGVGQDLDHLKYADVEAVDIQKYPAGETPEEAWETLLQIWKDHVRDHNLGVYTEISKLAFRDYQDVEDSYFEKNIETYVAKPFEVRSNDTHAVIYFGGDEGWENSPFLFVKAEEGWKYDIVNQRKYVRMGQNPYWGIELADYPYIYLLLDAPYFMGQDIPLPLEDLYRVENDQKIAEEILAFEEEVKTNFDDFEILLSLGILYTRVSFGPKAIPLLERARKLKPKHPLPYKYLAIAYVDTSYQYRKAIKHMEYYYNYQQDDIFADKFLGYLYYMDERYQDAVVRLEKAMVRQPKDVYNYCKLARAYGQLYLNAMPMDLRRYQFQKRAEENYHKAIEVSSVDYWSIIKLRTWLITNGLISTGSR